MDVSFDEVFRVIQDVDFFVDEDTLDSGTAYLSDLKQGEQFYIGSEAYIMLEDTGVGGCMVIKKELLGEPRRYGADANWVESPIREYLNGEYYEHLSLLIGRDNIIQMRRDLSSLDGLDDYGSCDDYVSLLTACEYARFHKILGVPSNYSNWWWTITPFSTPSNNYTRCVCCVSSNGALCWLGCGYCLGVRPFLILNSSISVS